jgi:hypothetical protein
MPKACLMIALLLLVICQRLTLGKDNSPGRKVGNVERVLSFTVELEIQASGLRTRKDVCLAFGNGLVADQQAVLSDLRRDGFKVRLNEWCNHGPRGLSVQIVALINETVPGVFDVVVELGDNSIRPGEHFATLLRRGAYEIWYKSGYAPRLLSYQETCCTRRGAPSP